MEGRWAFKARGRRPANSLARVVERRVSSKPSPPLLACTSSLIPYRTPSQTSSCTITIRTTETSRPWPSLPPASPSLQPTNSPPPTSSLTTLPTPNLTSTKSKTAFCPCVLLLSLFYLRGRKQAGSCAFTRFLAVCPLSVLYLMSSLGVDDAYPRSQTNSPIILHLFSNTRQSLSASWSKFDSLVSSLQQPMPIVLLFAPLTDSRPPAFLLSLCVAMDWMGIQIANVARIMKDSLPAGAKISKESKECLQECVSEFIMFIVSLSPPFAISLLVTSCHLPATRTSEQPVSVPLAHVYVLLTSHPSRFCG
jgi:hypothetical protein